MKGLLGKFQPSRKILLIFGGVIVLCGATGSAAVFIGRDTLIGPSYASINGLACTDVQTVKTQRKNHVWLRKYIVTEPADGMARIKTALRVAKAVQESSKADLVQVVVLDKNGPKDRADIRGRVVGADVIYVPNPAIMTDETDLAPLTARYVERPASADGEFYGERIDMPMADASALMASLTDKADCLAPVVPEAEHGSGKKESGGKSKGGGHGDAKAKGGDAHGSDAHGGDAQGGDAHGGEAKSGEGEAKPADGHEAEKPAGDEKPGLIASLTGKVKGLIFGAEKPAEHPAEPQDAHAAVEASPPGAEAAVSDAAKDAPKAETPAAAPGHEPAATAATPEVAKTEAAKGEPAQAAEQAGWFSSLKAKVLGNGDEKPAEQKADAAADAAKPLVSKESEGSDNVLPRGISLR
ncbi:hypothetical protein [Rhizobium paknamense]|uniref:Uncharacterized protein n=1 Tax=Rhizobium paknamense TaxID=1206817 RepID=A0ABU0ID86_9HYPH|nr:hypothetical protein [Rhizobium paknamense]MDQ0456199.1 hypothetical protein [Rhizobium paknamense]